MLTSRAPCRCPHSPQYREGAGAPQFGQIRGSLTLPPTARGR